MMQNKKKKQIKRSQKQKININIDAKDIIAFAKESPLLFFAIVALICALLYSPILEYFEPQYRIIDGDTIELRGERIRLHGLDAPELSQTCFKEKKKKNNYECGVDSKLALEKIIEENQTSSKLDLTCKKITKDKYQRTIAKCFVANMDIGSELVKQGWAVAYTRYSKDYLPQESFAKEHKLGIWQGSFQNPETYRIMKK